MPRVARVVIPGVPHHITQRGNNRQDVFFVDDDRRVYLGMLQAQAERFGLSVLGYCLMTNHVHIVGTPADAASLAKALGRTHFLYAQYINRLHGRSGHLWQNRFYSCALDERHLWTALCYVERNPVRARIVRAAWRYPWSSAGAHLGEPRASELLDLRRWKREWREEAWRETLRRPEDDAVVDEIRRWTHTGRPLGSNAFLGKLERLVGRRLRPLPIGRPKVRGQGRAGRRSSR